MRGWLFLMAGLASAVWVAAPVSALPRWQGFPNTPLTTLLFLAAAMAGGRGVLASYKISIVAGLAFSAAGDAFLMPVRDHFVAGLASFLVAHVCYVWAFTRDSRLAARRWPFVAWSGWGLLLVLRLWAGVAGPLRLPIVLYAAALTTMAAQAASRAVSRRELSALLAALGASFFVVSDSVLAYQRFSHPVRLGHSIVLGTYFVAQAGIALSVLLYRGPTWRDERRPVDRR
jgi:uncharacterized membrane protein YhhN